MLAEGLMSTVLEGDMVHCRALVPSLYSLPCVLELLFTSEDDEGSPAPRPRMFFACFTTAAEHVTTVHQQHY